MWTVSVRDPAVIADWKRQLDEYDAKSRWLWIPFYVGIVFSGLGVALLPAAALPYVAGVEAANLLVIGFYLSKYSYSSIVCPHCKDKPHRPRSKLMSLRSLEFCERCGYWLVDNEAQS
jgi:hypothetical protein